MFISPQVHEALLDAGVQFVDLGDGCVDLEAPGSHPGVSAQVQVKTWNRPLGPTQIAQLARTYPATRLLLVVPSISHQTLVAVENLGWSWITAPKDGPVRGELRLPGRRPVELGQPRDREPVDRSRSTRGRKPWQRSAIIRHLLLGKEWTQAALVEVCQVTQPRVSQVLNELHSEGLVARTRPDGPGGVRWVVGDYNGLFDRWLSTYPGPGGAAPTYWYGLTTIAEQAEAAIRHLQSARPHADGAHTPVVSGDAAADFLAPVRRSQIAVIYAPSGVNLSPVGLTPAPEEAATLKLVVPSDTSLWPSPLDNRSREMAPNAPFPLADPVQVTWDLLDSGRPDADQAAAAVRRALGEIRARDQWA